MRNTYLESNNISVFPSARRGQNAKYIESRLTTETAIANIVNKLLDVEGFIVTDKNDWTEGSSHDVVFNLYGYLFSIKNLNTFLTSFEDADALWVGIVLDTAVSGSTVRYEIYGQDEEIEGVSVYKGLELAASKEQCKTQLTQRVGSQKAQNCIFKYLKLCTKENGKWCLCGDSYIKFNNKSLEFDIDCGKIIPKN